jgi:hypothetical protein
MIWKAVSLYWVFHFVGGLIYIKTHLRNSFAEDFISVDIGVIYDGDNRYHDEKDSLSLRFRVV